MAVGVLVIIVFVMVALIFVMVSTSSRTPSSYTSSAVDWDALQDSELQSYLPDKKINAIKRYRELTGLGLKEAKDAIDYAIANPQMTVKAKSGRAATGSAQFVDYRDMPPQPPQPLAPVAVDWEAIRDEELQTYLPLKKINAIKRYMDLTGVGLAESKKAIEYVMANPDLVEKEKSRTASRLIDTDGAGVRDLIAAGKIEEAIQVYAQFMGVDEYTARDSIETMIAEDEALNRRAD